MLGHSHISLDLLHGGQALQSRRTMEKGCYCWSWFCGLRLPWWHLIRYRASRAVQQVNCAMVKGGFGFKQCPAGRMAAAGSGAMPVPGSFALLLLYPCLKWYRFKYLHKIKKPQTVTPACTFWMAAFGTLQKDLAQPVLTLLSWPWAPSYLVSISTGAAAVSHIRDTSDVV